MINEVGHGHLATSHGGLRCSVDANTVTISGELDAVRVAVVDDVFQRCPHDRDIDVDVSGITYIDAAGVRALLRAFAVLDAAGHTLHLVEPSEPVTRILKLAGLDNVFAVRHSIDR